MPMIRSALRRAAAVSLLALTGLLLVAGRADAHPYFLSSTPAPNVVLRSAPTEIDITYTETLDYPYSKVVLTDPGGHSISTHQIHAGGPSTLAVVPDEPLGSDGILRGTYVVDWTAVGSDGHTVIGSFAFSIGAVGGSNQRLAVVGFRVDTGSA